MKLCYDITEVCRLLGVTSRTLRFYESQGIIQSTVTPFSKRRMYTEAQLSEIRNVLLLRKLGLSVKSIGELQKNHISLEHALSERRVQLYALLEEKHRELAVITQALSALAFTTKSYSFNNLAKRLRWLSYGDPKIKYVKATARFCSESFENST